MENIYKFRLLKDLPEYPKDCVFILNKDGWRGYWEGGNWVIPKWLEALLYSNVPEPHDEMVDWFEPIKDNDTTVYEVDIYGQIRESTVYDFWVSDNAHTFKDRKTAEKVASQIKHILYTNKEDN